MKHNRTLRVGSRDSTLAVIQSRLVMDALQAAHPDVRLELVTMKTTGDKILDRTLDQVGGKGLFVRELDQALLEGRVDLTVHCVKDLPAQLNPALPLVAFSPREDPRDALVLPQGAAALRGPIGCSSLRRRLQLEALFPGVETVPVRGNVITRLEKLDRGEFGALVLAAAGLKRLGLAERISRYFTVDEMIPAAGQGILAVQCRAGTDTAFLQGVGDPEAAACALAERAYIQELDGGCSSPVAAHAVADGGSIAITGLYVDGMGRTSRGDASGPLEQGEALARSLARRLKEDAAWREK